MTRNRLHSGPSRRAFLLAAGAGAITAASNLSGMPRSLQPPGQLPVGARLAFEEDWSDGTLAPDRWYVLRKKWGAGNHGVVPENVRIETDTVAGRRQHVLVCEAHGDQYDGPIIGIWGKKRRVGGVVVSKPFFASGRFEVVMKIGSPTPSAGTPEDQGPPRGCVPAIWTYGYRWVEADPQNKDQFQSAFPLYNPNMPAYGSAANEYWSEIDFPEFGKDGNFDKALYNTFCQTRHDPNLFDASVATDGRYHTFTTEWRTELQPFEGITDQQVVEHLGYCWVHDKTIPFADYLGNPLKRLGKDSYAVYRGNSVSHWIDGKSVGTHTKYVPVMAGQLNLGVWLPKWAGPAPWKTAQVTFASVKVWQYDDSGDVRGVLTEDISNNFAPDGTELR